MSNDRSWMWRRLDDRGFLSDEFVKRVKEFLTFAYAQQKFVWDGKIKCPCSKCCNRKLFDSNVVRYHIEKSGFTRGYSLWYAHGESLNTREDVVGSSRIPNEEGSHYRTMDMDVMTPEMDQNPIRDEPPNPEAKAFFDLLKDADEPLWDGCKKQTKLSVVAQLLNVKSEYNIPEACYDRVISIIKSMLPDGEKLPDNLYKTKKQLAKLGLGYEKIDAYMSKMLLGHDKGSEKNCVSIPLGGPIYVPGLVGPLTRVPEFENAVFQELQSLKDEVSGELSLTCDEEIPVDDLRIIREDELVKKAFEEAFKGGQLAMDTSQVTEEHLSPRTTDDKNASVPERACPPNSEEGTMAIVPSETSNLLPISACRSKRAKKNHSGKRKYSRSRENSSFDESYIAKVEELARVKQKQEEQKADVRLHSFDSSRVPNCGATTKADKTASLKSASVSTKVKSTDTCNNIPIQFPEAVLYFEVYHNKKTSMKTQEFLVLGRQFLTEVRDKIYCLTDDIMKKAGQCDPSGYFLIEDVFCNDMRDSAAIDYSRPILDWLANSKDDALEKWESIVAGELQEKQKALLGSQNKQQLPAMKGVSMQNIRFCDLKFRLGAGYLYCHQGDCKHVIVLRDMRLIHPEDVQNRAAYPLITFQQKLRYKKCSACKIYRAEKMTVDDKWASLNPCYFCDVCYYMLHYADGILLYNDFRVYDLTHDYYHE